MSSEENRVVTVHFVRVNVKLKNDKQLNKGYCVVIIHMHIVIMDDASGYRERTNLLVVRKYLACPNIESMLFYFLNNPFALLKFGIRRMD